MVNNLKEDQMLQVQIAITGSYRENYGAHDWDGVGACPQYWKSKVDHTVVMACNVSLSHLGEVAEEIRSRMQEMSWSDDSSSCYFDAVVFYPNKLSRYEMIDFEYRQYDDIRSVPQEEIKRFLVAFGKEQVVAPAPYPYEQYDVV